MYYLHEYLVVINYKYSTTGYMYIKIKIDGNYSTYYCNSIWYI